MKVGIFELYNNDKSCLDTIQTMMSEYKLEQKRIETLKSKPFWIDEHTQLQEQIETIIPGTHLVAVPWSIESTRNLLKGGLLRIVTNSEDVIMNAMAQSGCHDNCEELLRTGMIKEYYTGYALSRDRLFRYHSWGVNFDDKIVETTEERIAYVSCEKYLLKQSQQSDKDKKHQEH